MCKIWKYLTFFLPLIVQFQLNRNTNTMHVNSLIATYAAFPLLSSGHGGYSEYTECLLFVTQNAPGVYYLLPRMQWVFIICYPEYTGCLLFVTQNTPGVYYLLPRIHRVFIICYPECTKCLLFVTQNAPGVYYLLPRMHQVFIICYPECTGLVFIISYPECNECLLFVTQNASGVMILSATNGRQIKLIPRKPREGNVYVTAQHHETSSAALGAVTSVTQLIGALTGQRSPVVAAGSSQRPTGNGNMIRILPSQTITVPSGPYICIV